MNSCCCRSHSDRTDPMACFPSFPRLHRIQSCRPDLEGPRGSCCMSNERRWGQMNGGMIQVLAKMVNQSAGRVCSFLHQLTLQLFARILYPLMSGWNTLKIPFTLSDTNELYYGIFDECGNIRCPIPTRTLLILISMMQYFLNLPKHGGACKQRVKCPMCRSTEDSLRNIHNPGYCRNVVPFSGSRTPKSEPSPGKEIWNGLRRLRYDKYGANLESFPSDESIPYGYAPLGCPCQRRHSQVSAVARQPSPYAHLSGPRALQSACEEELRSPMLAPDCRERSPVEGMSPEKVQRYYITHISDLYTAVVQNQHSRQLLGEGKPLKQRGVPCHENRRSAGGFMMMPQPYFNGMPWSWLHRDPRRMMRLSSDGKQGLPLDRRQSMKEEYQRLQPIEYSPRDNALQAMEPYRAPQTNSIHAMEPFRPQKSLHFSIDNLTWHKRPLVLENLPRNVNGYPREISGTEKCQMQWEDNMLVKVDEARQSKSPSDYWKQFKERNQFTIIHRPWSISKPLSPLPRERNYSLSRVETSPYQLETTKTLKRAREQNNLSNSLEPLKPNSDRKLLVIRACRRRILSSQKTNADIDQQKENIENRLERSNKASYTKIRQPRIKSVECAPRSLWENAEDITENPNYPDPEEYRKKTDKEHSKKKRHARKIAGESLFFITPAQGITSKPDIVRPNEFRVRPGDALGKKKSLLDQRTIERLKSLDKRVQFRFPIPQSSGRLIPTDSEKLNIKTWLRSKLTERPITQYKYKPESGDQTKPLPKLKRRSLAENVKQMKLSFDNERVRITERKTHFQSERTKTESMKSKSPEQLSRFSNVILTDKPVVDWSTKSLPRSSKSLEINPRSRSTLEVLRSKTTKLEIPRKIPSSLY